MRISMSLVNRTTAFSAFVHWANTFLAQYEHSEKLKREIAKPHLIVRHDIVPYRIEQLKLNDQTSKNKNYSDVVMLLFQFAFKLKSFQLQLKLQAMSTFSCGMLLITKLIQKRCSHAKKPWPYLNLSYPKQNGILKRVCYARSEFNEM